MKTILEKKPYSNHPEDTHLSVVLCEIDQKDHYVTWMHNSEDDGYFWGHYFETLREARIDYNKRGIRQEVKENTESIRLASRRIRECVDEVREYGSKVESLLQEVEEKLNQIESITYYLPSE